MRKTKRADKKPNAVRFKSKRKADIDVEVEDRLAACAKGDLQQIVHVGTLVENILKGEFGGILRSLVRGRSSMNLSESRQHGGTLSADRYLGRLDAYDNLLTDLEQYVTDKDSAISKMMKESAPEREDSMAEDPNPHNFQMEI